MKEYPASERTTGMRACRAIMAASPAGRFIVRRAIARAASCLTSWHTPLYII